MSIEDFTVFKTYTRVGLKLGDHVLWYYGKIGFYRVQKNPLSGFVR